MTVEIECATLADVADALAAGAGRLLLDNMSVADLRRAVEQVARPSSPRGVGASRSPMCAWSRRRASTRSASERSPSAPALDLVLLLTPIQDRPPPASAPRSRGAGWAQDCERIGHLQRPRPEPVHGGGAAALRGRAGGARR